MKILLIHGVGHKEASANAGWQEEWKSVVTEALRKWNPNLRPDFRFTAYDKYFEESGVEASEVAEALARLTMSGIHHGIGDLFARRRGLADISDTVRWTAGMVAQWEADEKLRETTRKVVEEDVADFAPDVVCAHSLGSLIAYDLFAQNQDLMKGRTFLTFGSQIGNPAVRSIFGGRVVDLEKAKFWYHLYNKEDHVFTAPIRIFADNFAQVSVATQEPYAAHDALSYFHDPNTVSLVWSRIADTPPTLSKALDAWSGYRAIRKTRENRALLIGINDYPDPANRLDGCVNDVYLMSSILQEAGLDAKDIRTLVNERATTAGIMERIDWLLDGARAGDNRFLFYSGHGAQVPAYGDHDEVDHYDECLVPYDFDWTPEKMVTDNQFCQMYSQLPYDTNFISVFDCCHSGGLTRAGNNKVRGIQPPDDIRHRALRWDPKTGMWVPREMRMAKRHLVSEPDHRTAYLGATGAEIKLGRGVPLWSSSRKFEARKAAYGHNGPFTPILFEACAEQGYAYEYRDGATPYGAFTFSLSKAFRDLRCKHKTLSCRKLLDEVARTLKMLQYDQHPVLVCPKAKDELLFP